MYRSNRRQTAQERSDQIFSLVKNKKECYAERLLSNCSQTSQVSFWDEVLLWRVSTHNMRNEQVSVISSEMVSACGCLRRCVCMLSGSRVTHCSFWEHRWRFGWGGNFHDLTSKCTELLPVKGLIVHQCNFLKLNKKLVNMNHEQGCFCCFETVVYLPCCYCWSH